jgi:hypothetical protein
MVTTEPIAEESRKEAVKSIALGMPSHSGEPVATIRVLSIFRTLGCGLRPTHRHYLRRLLSRANGFASAGSHSAPQDYGLTLEHWMICEFENVASDIFYRPGGL